MAGMAYVPRKSMYGWTVYERKPKPVGVSRYAVGTGTCVPYKDFSRYAKAVRWLKEQHEHIEIYKKVIPPMP